MAHNTGTQSTASAPRQRRGLGRRGSAPHLLSRAGIWYWRRRLGQPHDTVAKNKYPEIKLSLSTGDRATARARAALLDAAYARIRIVHAATPPNPATLAGILVGLRDRVVAEGEYRRAARAPDSAVPPPCSTPAPLPAALADEVLNVVAAADAALDEPPAGKVVPAALADGIIRVVRCADAAMRAARSPRGSAG